MTNPSQSITDPANVIYISPDERFASYDKSYALSDKHFLIANSIKSFIDSIVAEGLLKPRAALELGCGQGEFLDFIRSTIKNHTQEMPVHYLGVDGSVAGIRTAARKFPECYWIADSVENFLIQRLRFEGHETYRWLTGYFDLVVDKTGLTYLKDYNQARAVVSQIKDLMNTGGIYIYIASRNFYQTTGMNSTYKGWPTGWMEILQESFGNVKNYDDQGPDSTGYYKRVFVKEAENKRLYDSEITHDNKVNEAALSSRVLSMAHEAVLWTDGTRYIEDLLSSFGLPFCTAFDSLSVTSPHVIMRHDVDWSIENALAMATLEAKNAICATYFLLHPDGEYSSSNYFGHVSGNKLHIRPEIFAYAKRLIDLGHEVGLHNDLITLSLNTGKQPIEFLEQILNAFRQHNIIIHGTVAHGSGRCRRDGYVNYQIFRDKMAAHPGFPLSDVRSDSHVIKKFAINMQDYDLAYEANFIINGGLYISDSGTQWLIEQGSRKQRFEKFAARGEMLNLLRQMLNARDVKKNIQCLIHSCHWSFLLNFNPTASSAIAKRTRLNR